MLPQLKIIMIDTAKDKKFNIYISLSQTASCLWKPKYFFLVSHFSILILFFIIKLCPHILPLSGPNIVGNYEMTRSLFITIQIIPTVES